MAKPEFNVNGIPMTFHVKGMSRLRFRLWVFKTVFVALCKVLDFGCDIEMTVVEQ